MLPLYLINYTGLILSAWLGIYVITHRGKSWVALYSGLTLWALAGLFANIILDLPASSAPIAQPLWLRIIFPVWPQGSDQANPAAWTRGWATSLGLVFWYHATVLILPGRPNSWRLTSLYAAYALAAAAILVRLNTNLLFTLGKADPLLIDTQKIGILYPFFAFALLLYCGLSVFNLLEARRLSVSVIHKNQLNSLIAASLAVGLASLLSIAGSLPGLPVPVFWVSLLLVAAICFFGFGVIRYSALLEHRILQRDIAYSAVSTGLVVLLYLGMFAWLKATYAITEGVIVFLIPLVVLSHSVVEEVRQILEGFIYDRKTRTLRARLNSLSRLAREQADINEVLSRSLETMCVLVRSTYGVILLFEGDTARPAGTYRWRDSKLQIPSQNFLADDARHLNPGDLPEPFAETTLLIPLYASEKQFGALLLGRPENGIHFSNDDLQLLLDPSERIGELIVKSRRITDYLDQFVQLPLQPIESSSGLIPIEWVEDALQNIFDYAYLGESPLVNLKQTREHFSGQSITHLDKGKAVNRVISTAVEKLRPDTNLPKEPIPREWHPYLILHDAYFEGLPNRDIIAKLYVSDGTFNRTRRSALRSVTRVLSELETEPN